MCSLGVSGASAGRVALPPPSSADLRCLPLWLGYGSPASSVFRRLVRGGFLDPYQFSRKKNLRAVLWALECLEVHVRGQSLLVSFGHNSCILSFYQGGTHSPSLLELLEWCLILKKEKREGLSSFGLSLSGGGLFGSRLLVHGEVSPFRMDSESLDFSEDLSGSRSSSRDRPFCIHTARWTHSPSGGQAFPPFSILPRVLEKIAQEGADLVLGLYSGSETMVLKVIVSSGGTSQNSPSSEGPCFPSLYLSLWPLSGRKERKESRRAFLLEI